MDCNRRWWNNILYLDVTRKMISRIQWRGLRSAALDLNLPGRINDIEDISALGDSLDEELLKEIHHLLFEIHVVEGDLVCPESGRRFTVRDSIPNMLLHEDEV